MAEALDKTAVLLNASEWCAERDASEAAAALLDCKQVRVRPGSIKHCCVAGVQQLAQAKTDAL